MEKEKINFDNYHECLYNLNEYGICKKCGNDIVEQRNTMIEYIENLEQTIITLERENIFYKIQYWNK